MDNKKENEMEQIQRGLEAFLEKELDYVEMPEDAGQRKRSMAQPGQDAGRQQAPEGSLQIIGQKLEEEEPDPESVIYDWDSEAPRMRGNGQERMRIRADTMQKRAAFQRDIGSEGAPSRRDNGPERAFSQRDSDSDRAPSRRDSGSERASSRQDYAYEDRYSGQRDDDFTARGRKRGREQPSGKTAPGRPAQPREEDSQMAKKTSKSQKTQKKKRKKKHRLLKFLIAAAIIFVLLGVGLYQLVGVVYGKMTYHEITSVTQAPMKEDGVVNILLIGNDSRENGEDGRSDAMILLSISSKTKTIYMTSLLRDMYVEIPGHDGNRLNAAYSFGGAELLMETIEKNFDISVNRYVLVNFEAFASLVDAVGGIELELTSEEIEYVNGYLVEYNILTDRPQGTDNMDTSVSGLVHLNGPQALAYSRNRYLGTDFGRTDRQRKVLTAVIKKLPSAMISNPGGLMEGLLPNLTTNLTQKECFSLSLMAGKLITYEIVSDSIPQPGTYSNVTIRKMAVLEVDFDANIRYLKEKIYGE